MIMNYAQALRYLDSFLNLEKLSQLPRNSFFNLKRMAHLLEISGHPEKNFFPVLIAGTTGKGSTGFFFESILKANKVRVGYYHSPHVEDSRERIRIQGEMASRTLWANKLSSIRSLLTKKPLPKKLGVLTYFEILTFLAVWIYAESGVQVGIFEIGLGGRLDATNILKAPVVLLTPIHLDHEALLGNTVKKIAGEKAAIIKNNNHVVIGWQSREALSVIRAAIRKKKAHLWVAKPLSGISLGLSGDFQKRNAGMAMRAAEVLKKLFHFPVRSELSQKGLQFRNWKGRMECFQKYGREFILDGAHNPLSSRALVRSLPFNRPDVCKRDWLIFGAMNDKNSRKMLEILSGAFSKVIFVKIQSSRAKSLGMLAAEAKGLFKYVLTAQNIEEALHFFKVVTAAGDKAVITGSFYLVGEARKILRTGIYAKA